MITRWLPGFLPGIGSFANPWVLLALLAALSGSFLYGLHIGNDRLESYRVAIQAVGQAQEERTAARVKADKKLKKEVDREHKTRLDRANSRVAALVGKLRADPGGSVLPVVPPDTPDPDRTCFGRAELDRALREFTAGTAELVGEGDRAVVGLDAAKKWAQEQASK